MERNLAEIVAGYGPRGAAFDSVNTDVERLASYLEEGLDPSAQGAVIVASAHLGVFEPLALGLPVPTRVAAGPAPALFHLAFLADDHPTYAVLMADQQEATVTLIDQATARHSVSLESSDYPRWQKTGGLSQRRLKAPAGERMAAFARGIAEETRRALDEAEVDMLVVAGSEVMASALNPEFHHTVAERIIANLRLDLITPMDEVIETTLPLVAQAERDREIQAVAALRDAIGTGGRGVAGVDATLTALQAGQVGTLIVVDDFAAAGWADYRKPVFGVGPVPRQHPTGGDPAALRPVALADELVRLALLTGGDVQIVHTAATYPADPAAPLPTAGRSMRSETAALLDESGGVGALLRYA